MENIERGLQTVCTVCCFFHKIITLLQPASPCQLWATHQPVSHRFALKPSNGAADSGDGCLHCGKYEIKRKSLINWQQAPQDREAGDGMINLTWGWSAGPLRRGWWMYSGVRCWAVKKNVRCVVCSFVSFGSLHVYTVCTLFHIQALFKNQ